MTALSRRTLFSGASVIVGATAGRDPVLALYRQYLAIENYARLAQVNELDDAQTDLVDKLMLTRATSREGVRIKLRLLKERMQAGVDSMDSSEAMPFLCLNDCLELLGEETV